MRKWITFAFLVVGVAGGGYAQLREMPKEVKEFLGNYIKDSTARRGPLEAKSRKYFADSIQIKDLRVRAVEVYTIKHVSIDAYPDTVPLSEIISPSGWWRVLVMAHGKPLYELLMEYAGIGNPRYVQASYPNPGDSFNNEMWNSLLNAYPESTGINPVFVTVDLTDAFRGNFSTGNNFLYFRQKGPRQIHYLKTRFKDDTLKTLFSSSIENLDDSKKLVGFLKRRGLNKEAIRSDGRMGLKPEEVKSGSSSFYMRVDSTSQYFKDIESQKVTSPTGGEK
jgi:hypothetical protein